MTIKITYSQKSRNEILKDFQDFLGNGCFRDVYKHNTENTIIKFPTFGERDYSNCYYENEEPSTMIDPDTDVEEYEFPFVSILKDHHGVWYYTTNGHGCIEDEAEATLKEAMIYMNCPEEYRIALCPVLELGFTRNNIPYIIMEYCDNIYGDWIYEDEGEKFIEKTSRTVREIYYENKGVLFGTSDSPIDIMGEFIELSVEVIYDIKAAFIAIMELFNLSWDEQINNYHNLGFSASGRIYMTDYNEL